MADTDSSTHPRAFIAYKITCSVTGKGYVGITKQRLKARWSAHVCSARGTRSGKYALHEAMATIGLESFAVEHIASATTYADLLDIERILIKQHGTLSPSGYNNTTGGQGHVASDATRALLSSVRKGRIIGPEHRARIGAAHSGRKHTDEARANMKAGRDKRTWKHTTDSLAKLSASLSGRPVTAETRAKMSNALRGKGLGRKLSDETRAKMSLARTGKKRKPFTREHRANLAAAGRQRACRDGSVG